MQWSRDGGNWPLRECSRFIEAGGVRWHVQVLGHGPPIVLLHGTGASSHSWRDVAPRLASQARVLVPDLPGHGFSGPLPPSRQSLAGMAQALQALIDRLDVGRPLLGVGHSAGAALLAQMALDRPARWCALVGFNAALVPLRRALRWMVPAARLLAAAPFVPQLVASHARDPASVQRLVDRTGSRLGPTGSALYARLMRDPDHVAGALAMMAHWDLQAVWRRLPELTVPVVLAAADGDRTVPAAQSAEAASRIPHARLMRLNGLGHLAHEEAPEAAAAIVADAARRHGRGTLPDGLVRDDRLVPTASD